MANGAGVTLKEYLAAHDDCGTRRGVCVRRPLFIGRGKVMKFNVCENQPSAKGGVNIINSWDNEAAAQACADALNQKWANGAGVTLKEYLAAHDDCGTRACVCVRRPLFIGRGKVMKFNVCENQPSAKAASISSNSWDNEAAAQACADALNQNGRMARASRSRNISPP